MTPRDTGDLLQRLTPARGPLPPQRWGFLPTGQFWRLAARTPILFGLWFVTGFFYDWLRSFGLPWWQNGLGCLVFTAIWAGLVERWSRQYFIRCRMRALSSPEDPFDVAQSELVPAQEPQRGLPIVATSEFWDYAYERLFGRAKIVAYVVLNAMFFVVAFYPSWQVLAGSFLVMVAISLGLGWWQRRLLRSQLDGAHVGPSLVGSSMPGLQAGDDR